MLPEKFEAIVEHQLKSLETALTRKEIEYCKHDILHCVRTSALLQKCSTREALAGMMAKNTISLYDMLRGKGQYVDKVWEDQINENIMDLLVLRALIEELKGCE